jgi:hypothetical protein
MTMRHAALIVLLGAAAARPAAAQGVIRGVAFDSLAHAPLARAVVWLQGTTRQAVTDGAGRFHLDGVPAGRYVLVLTHPDLDALGLYTVAAAVEVARDTSFVTLAVPSLAGLWRRHCGGGPPAGEDSGLVFGVVQDVDTRARLAGAVVIPTWVRLLVVGSTDVRMVDHDLRVRTDSTGAYYACGVPTDVSVWVRAYAGSDSTGAVQIPPGNRAVARRDLAIAVAPAPPAPPARPATRRPAALRGRVTGVDGNEPVSRARVTVLDATSILTAPDGTFLLTGLPAGTQWVRVEAIGREPAGRAVELRGGDTAAVDVVLSPRAVTLDTVRVTAPQSRTLQEFEERRRTGEGYTFTEEEIRRRGSIRAVLGGIPSVIVTSGSAEQFVLRISRGGRTCPAALYIDGRRADHTELTGYRSEELVGLEVYVSASGAPIRYQSVAQGCGVVLVWTKYVQ